MVTRRPGDLGGRQATTARYSYTQRTADAIEKRAAQGNGFKDSYLSSDAKMYTAEAGDNWVRILPPTWGNAEHFGYDIYLHYEVGADKAAYLCNALLEKGRCPLCEERQRADREGETDYARSLKATKRVLCWIVNRKKEMDGVVLWSMPWTIDRDVCKLMVDKRTGEVYPIDNPDDGYDFEFERKGAGLGTEYLGLKIARKPSPLGKQEWLDYAIDHPIPDLLVFYDYEHIEKAFSGGVATADGEIIETTTAVKEEKEPSRIMRASLRK